MRYLSKDILEEVITQRPSHSYKSNFGRVVLIGGNRQYGGAIIMSTEACINSGAGLTTVITDVKNHGPLHALSLLRGGILYLILWCLVENCRRFQRFERLHRL